MNTPSAHQTVVMKTPSIIAVSSLLGCSVLCGYCSLVPRQAVKVRAMRSGGDSRRAVWKARAQKAMTRLSCREENFASRTELSDAACYRQTGRKSSKQEGLG